MIVCLCKVVSDRALRAARDAGARTVAEIGLATGAGTDCGGCQGAIAMLLAQGAVEPARAVARCRGGEDAPCRRAGGGSLPLRVAASEEP